MKNILLDTDVVLDFLLDRKPFSDDTLHILLKCEKKEMNAFVTPVIVANTYYLLRQKASHSYVIEQLKILLKIIPLKKIL
jgi:predicted nucleic acid-binding protein